MSSICAGITKVPDDIMVNCRRAIAIHTIGPSFAAGGAVVDGRTARYGINIYAIGKPIRNTRHSVTIPNRLTSFWYKQSCEISPKIPRNPRDTPIVLAGIPRPPEKKRGKCMFLGFPGAVLRKGGHKVLYTARWPSNIA